MTHSALSQRRWARLTLLVARRPWQLTALSASALLAVALIAGAFIISPTTVADFWQNLYINLGTSLLFAVLTYVFFERIARSITESTTSEWANLDQHRLLDRFASAHRRIIILEIWTGLLNNEFRERFLHVLREALVNNVEVEIYLNDPDSEAARRRSAQLSRCNPPIDVPHTIMDNLRWLCTLREGRLAASKLRNLRVYIGHEHPNIQVYRWDDRALLTFYSVEQPTYDIPQIETHMAGTPWGLFIDNHRTFLIEDSRTIDLDRYLEQPMEMPGPDGTRSSLGVSYVALDGRLFVRHRWLRDNPSRAEGMLVTFPGSVRTGTWRLNQATDTAADLAGDLFARKYGEKHEIYFEARRADAD